MNDTEFKSNVHLSKFCKRKKSGLQWVLRLAALFGATPSCSQTLSSLFTVRCRLLGAAVLVSRVLVSGTSYVLHGKTFLYAHLVCRNKH